MAMALSLRQRASQTQAQKMGARQIQSLKLLSMSADDLREAVLKEVENNPALEIVEDERYKNFLDGGIHVGTASAAGQEKSDAFQEILESRADERKSLYAHLTEQLNLLPLSQAEARLCQKIVGNLDARGFYVLSPLSLLDGKKGETQALLQKCLNIVQRLDPPGICVESAEKSLLLQARLKGNAPSLALFLLDGRLDFLNPPQAPKILEKIRAFLSEQKKLSFQTQDFSFLESVGESQVMEALAFIQGLDPYPARNYGHEEARYVVPEIFVEKEAAGDFGLAENSGNGKKRQVIDAGDCSFKIRISDSVIPKVKIAGDFLAAKKSSAYAKAAMQSAKIFLESLEYRENTIAKAACAIAARQIEFFKNGPGNLAPLRQADIAKELGVHESTVSRMANSKYLQCQWGIFPVKYFFTLAVAGNSKESVLLQIQKIIEQSSPKKMSDQKICDALGQRGIKISRRAVAKYRAQLGLENSYKR